MNSDDFKQKLRREGPHLIFPGQEGSRYPVIRINGVQMLAHRYAYELKYGKLPEGMCVCIICDRDTCCEPRHLVAVPSHDRKKINSLSNKIARGEDAGAAKLTNQEADEIKQLLAEGDLTQAEIADAYNISFQSVNAIHVGRSRA